MSNREQGITPKQENFAQHVATGKSLTDAYRQAGYAITNAKTANEAASRLLANSKVLARVESLRADHMCKLSEIVSYSYRDAMKELDDVIRLAKESKNPSAYVAALNLKQKISGLHVAERRNELSPVSGMTYEQMKAALEALAALRKARMKDD
jgi:phage terminase small subunit